MSHSKPMVICDRTAYVDGSQEECSDCRTTVWLSDSTVRVLESKGIQKSDVSLYCVGCALPVVAHLDNIEIEPPSAEQLREIAESLMSEH